MKIALTGFANSGKTTLFNALTGMGIETTLYATHDGEPRNGTVKVPDQRMPVLQKLVEPKKMTYTTVEYVDYIGLTKGDRAQNRKVFDLINDADAVVHVVRAFEEEAVMHPMGSVDPVRDVEAFEFELIVGDLDLVDKRLERIESSRRKAQKVNEAELKALKKCKEILEAEKPLRDVEFIKEELEAMRHLQFLSQKPEVVVLNIPEDRIGSTDVQELLRQVQGVLDKSPNTTAIALSAKVEMEISELSADDAREFQNDLGITEAALDLLIATCHSLLGFITFFTVGPTEVRSWTLKGGSDALTAAGKIHTDIQRGFIRAETIGYEEFVEAGSLSTARDKGLLRLEGKTYSVKDGDIITFRFNV